MRGRSQVNEHRHMDRYNYDWFDAVRDEQEMAEWLRLGPAVGSVAPDFELPALDGGIARLSALRGRAVVLEFGSYTCPIFASRVAEMEALAVDFPEACLLVIYVREAHPGELRPPHQSFADKKKAAEELRTEQGIRRRILIDHIDGLVHRAYGAAPDCAYAIDALGRIITRLGWNDVATLRRTLDDLRAGRVPEPVETLGSPRSIYPAGQILLQRGGRKALLDFYESGPPSLREAFRNSADSDVRAALALLEKGGSG